MISKAPETHEANAESIIKLLDDIKSGAGLPTPEECSRDIDKLSRKIEKNEAGEGYGRNENYYDNRPNYHLLGLAYFHRGREGDLGWARLYFNRALEIPERAIDVEMGDSDEEVYGSLKWVVTKEEQISRKK